MNNKEKKEEKFHLSLVVAGHVDAGKKKIEEKQLFANSISWFTNSCLHYFIITGKSTTVGHLIFNLGGISEREMKKLQGKQH
jgi:translation elongation factor EF-1alpha